MKWTARLSSSGCETRDTHRCESRFVRASAFKGRRLSSKEMVDVAQRDSAELLAPGALFHFPGYQPMSSPTAAPVVSPARTMIYLGMDVHKDSVTIAVLPADASAPTRIDQYPNWARARGASTAREDCQSMACHP